MSGIIAGHMPWLPPTPKPLGVSAHFPASGPPAVKRGRGRPRTRCGVEMHPGRFCGRAASVEGRCVFHDSIR
jgi:hypothetical protein